MTRNIQRKAAHLLVFCLLVAAWQAYVQLLDVPRFVLPGPQEFASSLYELFANGGMIEHVGTTLWEIVIGLSLGVAVGIVAGVTFAQWPLLERMADPLLVIIQATPKISLAPLLILWLGLGISSKIALVALVTFFPVMANTVTGIRTIAPEYFQLMKITGVSPLQRFRRLQVPFALPHLLAGIKVAVSLGVTAAVIGELMGAERGLGYLLALGQETASVNIVLSAVFVLSLIGLIGYRLVELAETRLLTWHESQAHRLVA